MGKQKKTIGTLEDYIKANRKASREIELEANGGKWVAKNKIHKSKKAYNRKEGKHVDFPLFMYIKTLILFQIKVVVWHLLML